MCFYWAENWERVDAVSVGPILQARVSLMIRGISDRYSRYAEKYTVIIDNELRPVVAQHFPQSDFILQDDNAPLNHVRIIINNKTENNIIIIILRPAQ